MCLDFILLSLFSIPYYSLLLCTVTTVREGITNANHELSSKGMCLKGIGLGDIQTTLEKGEEINKLG